MLNTRSKKKVGGKRAVRLEGEIIAKQPLVVSSGE
jgi:hypothetical protein